MMTMNLKKKMKMGNAENEKEFEILIHSDLPIAIVIECYSFKNRIKQPKRKIFSF